MGGELGNTAQTTARRPGGRCSPTPTILATFLVVVTAIVVTPAPATAQQDTTRARIARDSARADSLLQARRDTAAVDTTLTPRERALKRLRALPITPVQPDTTAADSLAADSLAADSLAADSLAGGAAGDTTGARVVPTDPIQGLPEGVELADSAADTTRLRPEPPDTLGVPVGEDRAVVLPVEGRDRRNRPQRRRDAGPVVEANVRAQLETLSGYVPTQYQGDAAVFWAERNQLEISGTGRIAQQGSTLETDSLLVYDGGTGVVCGYGEPVLSGEGDPVTSRRVCFDIEREVGMAEAARTRFTQGASWYVQGPNNRVFILPGDSTNTLYGERTQFTSCDLEHPHYTFQAQSLKMVEGEMMVARDITLRFDDVPVFWLPWMVQSMKRGRRSGLLMPQFGVNDIVRNSTGYSRHLSNLGFYWAMGEHASAKATFEWFAGNWTAVDGGLTYYWRRQFLQGTVNATHYWRQQESGPASREFTLRTSNSWQPDERTSLRLNANYASSTQFVRDNSFDPRELNQSIRSAASANRSFDWGSLTLGADRRQQLSTGQVDWTLPSLNLSLSPITVFSTEDGFDLTWSGSGNATRRTKDVFEDSLPNVRDSESLSGAASHRISAGRLSLSQQLNYDQEILGAKPALDTVGPDTLALPEETGEQLTWSTSLGYQQNLWVGTTLSPSLSVSGRQVRDEETRQILADFGRASGEYVAAPLRLSTGASLSTSIYGFWPGVGSYSRIRHKIAPSVRWSYSPEPTVTALQDSVFGTRNLREQNRITLQFNQTFEAKVESEETRAARDSIELGQPGEPTRLPQAEKITLLALNTTAFDYDFVAAEEDGRGFLTDQVTNSVRSDLVQGLQLTVTHDLFEEGTAPGDGGLAPRTLEPFLTRLSASFSIDNDFWLFRLLGITSGQPAGESEEEDPEGQEGELGSMRLGGAESDPERAMGGVGSIVPRGQDGGRQSTRRQGVGRWQAQLSYSLQRGRQVAGVPSNESQLLQANVSFDPTEKWSVRWSTAYSFTENEFANHYLTLSRDLHRWTANFDFIKAQNGNFAMQFRVQLRDNPDLKLDYDQRTRVPARGGSVPAPQAP